MPVKRRKGAKSWYSVYSADVLPGEWIGEALASSPESLMGRHVEVVLRDVTGDFTHERYQLWFKIFRVDENRAYARFIKEMLTHDYVRTLVQRRSSRIDVMSEGTTKDGHIVRIFNLIVTAIAVRHSQERAIRSRVHELMTNAIPQLTLEELVRGSLFGEKVDIGGEARKMGSKVAPIKNSDVRKIVILRAGPAEPEMEELAAKTEEPSPGAQEAEAT